MSMIISHQPVTIQYPPEIATPKWNDPNNPAWKELAMIELRQVNISLDRTDMLNWLMANIINKDLSWMQIHEIAKVYNVNHAVDDDRQEQHAEKAARSAAYDDIIEEERP